MWTRDAERPVPLWRPGAGADARAILAFTTRRGGVSAPPFDTLNLGRSTVDLPGAVRENRRRVLDALGLDPERIVTAGQVLGADVVRADLPGHVPGCDALVTTRAGLALAVTAADCMPLVFAAPGVVAVAHSGWRGTAAGVLVATLRAVCEAGGVAPSDVTVHLGPCIRGCCYEVGPDVAAIFPAESLRRDGDRVRLDLPTVARAQLAAAGVLNLEDTGACTACEPYWYFSHRRDRGATGRHWAVAALHDVRTGAGV